MKEKELTDAIINLIKNHLTVKDAMVISATDYLEKRVDNMIIVGITNVEQMNFSLPDYKYTLAITINSFIADDRSGSVFNTICKDVSEAIQYKMNARSFDFFNQPVCGWLNFDKQFNSDSDANVCVITSEIIASF